jgi:hypothetical protein
MGAETCNSNYVCRGLPFSEKSLGDAASRLGDHVRVPAKNKLIVQALVS